MAGTIFGSLVAGLLGSMVAEEFFDSMDDIGFDEGDPSEQLGDEQTGDAWADYFGGDFAGDF